MGIRVGIDLGTTYSAVAYVNEQSGKSCLIPNSYGEVLTPSVLCFKPDGQILFGQDAKNEQEAGDENTASFFKRSMGVELFGLNMHGKRYNATDLSAILLSKLKAEAESGLGERIEEAVITVPAYFGHREREATLEAGKRAGLHVQTIINEPTAAALAYGLNDTAVGNTIMIYDLGGGTFDVTIARIEQDCVTVLGTNGNHALGGKDWDDRIAEYLMDELLERYDVDIYDDWEARSTLRVLAEKVKKQLSQRQKINVPMNFGGVRCSLEFSQEIFKEISASLMLITKDVIDDLMSSIGITWHQIDGVILVGGSTRMTMVRDYVREMSGKEPLAGVHPDEAVALGAAIRANMEQTAVRHSLPAAKTKPVLSLKGAKSIRDVTAHALGTIAVSLEGTSYINSTIVSKNTLVPASGTKTYELVTGKRPREMDVYVLIGEYLRPLDNDIVHRYVISGITPTKSNTTRIAVNYQYDANGVVKVSASQDGRRGDLPVRIEKVPEDMNWTDENPADHFVKDISIMLAIDVSGSMAGAPLDMAKKAVNDFIRNISVTAPQTRIGLIGFAERAKLIAPLSDDYDALMYIVNHIRIGDYGALTNEQPLTSAYNALADCDDAKYIVVLTDGYWFDGADDRGLSAAERCKIGGIEIIALGFGAADENYLQQISSMKDLSSLTDLDNLRSEFSRIAQVIGSTSSKINKIIT
ncbi:Hsp70 family protein [Selenomonas sp. AE3005]|uniref:Hsp70 family protein n=1 Tax=Selenomonas sp. AE3005 TaxID=1485543 RepID=UPI000691E821|nr:Hsp70 family protein [Selenomonas sp. AE3005]